MANIQTDATTKFYMNQANKIVDLLSEILPTIYYNVFKDDFDVFMYGLWLKPDENHPPILDKSVLHMGETFQTLEQTNWKAMPANKQIEWLKRLDLQALLKALRFRPVSLDIFCEKNSLVKGKMEKVLQAMINWRNYGVGHKSVFKYEQMDEKVFKLNILEPVWELYDLLSRNYPRECELLRKTLKEIETRMRLPDTSIARLVGLSGLPEQTVREVLAMMKIDVGQDGTIKGENESELVDSIKRLSKKDSVKRNQKLNNEGDEVKKSKKKLIIAITGAALLLLIMLVAILLTQCGKKTKTVVNSDGETIEITEEATTVDNRRVVDPFKDMIVEEDEDKTISSYTDEYETFDDIQRVSITIKNKKDDRLDYKILTTYPDKTEFEANKEELKGMVEEQYGNSNSEEDAVATDDGYDGSYEDETEESYDYNTERPTGQILIITLDDATIKAHPDINYVGSNGEKYYAYEVKGIKFIRTASDLDLVNNKSIKKVKKQTEDQIDALQDSSDQSIASKKYIGYYAVLPKNNTKDSDAYIYIIYEVKVSGENNNIYASFNEIPPGTYYYFNEIKNPRFNYKGNNQIYFLNDDNEIVYGDDYQGGGIIDSTVLEASVKEIYKEEIIGYKTSHNIKARPYKKNKKIKIY